MRNRGPGTNLIACMNPRTCLNLAAIASITLFAAIPVAGAAKLSPDSTAEIRKLLNMLGDICGKEVGETRFGEMATGDVISIPFDADATVEYHFNVICDDDCENVDLAAQEADGSEIDVDDADDNAPVLNVHESEYRSASDKPKGILRPMTIEIRMKSCKAETCGYGLRVSASE